jgi:hypothetical protein
MGANDITYNDLTENEKRIFLSVRSKGYQVSPRAIRQNPFEEAWTSSGAFGAPAPTTTTVAPTTTTVAPTTTTVAPTTTTVAPTTTTTTTV